MTKLNSVKFATVAETTRTTNPSASVRANGKIMFSDSANKMIGYDGKNVDRLYFKLGSDDDGVIYLVPAKAEDANVLKAAKNNDSFQFNDIKTIASLGMLPKNRYSIAELKEGEIVFYSLTLKDQSEVDAEDKANKVAHTPVTEGEIKARMDRRTPLAPKAAPTKKELDAAAKKAAKADFKAGK